MSDRFFDRIAPSVLAALVLIGGYYGQRPLAALAMTLLFTVWLTRAWSRLSLRALRFERETSDERAFPGDELLLTLRLTNDKLLPLPWVEVDETLPQALTLRRGPKDTNRHSELPLPDGDPKATPEAGRLRLACSLGWKERATWRYRLSCRRRGIYQLGPAVVTSGDPFGFFPRSSKSGKTSRVVVYPKLIPLEQLGLPAGFPLGDSKPPLWIFEDPSRNVGVRDYRREDPFRRIHWKASARRQELQVKVHEPTTTLEVALFLAVDSFSAAAPGSDLQPPTIDHEAFEHAVSVAASVAHLLLQRRHPVGLYVNGGAADSRDPLILPPAGSREQLIRILEALAGVEPAPCLPMATLLAEVVPRLPWGSSVILVAGSLPDPLPASLQTLERMGRKPIVLAGRC